MLWSTAEDDDGEEGEITDQGTPAPATPGRIEEDGQAQDPARGI